MLKNSYLKSQIITHLFPNLLLTGLTVAWNHEKGKLLKIILILKWSTNNYCKILLSENNGKYILWYLNNLTCEFIIDT